ncbi:MAG: type II toxin-antitoxin system Phd/YefM family antitoxin [Candidatus Dadabacteria bacterium]|jgi:prevent-host-death family protein|nr:type II toxin-antitoxin system Phd/YefM family antitoxin [Candidatus Dadabacteria bacterium]
MRFISIREFRDKASKLLREEISKDSRIVITKRGKPFAVVSPFTKDDIKLALAAALDDARKILKSADIKEDELLKALENVRKKVYGTAKSRVRR